MIRTIAFACVLCCIAGCYERRGDSTLFHTYVNADSELWGRVNDGEPRRLLREAQAYRPVVSPDGDWLAVEVAQMSNLTVVRLFKRDGDTLVAVDSDVNNRAWRWALSGSGVQLNELSHTRTQVAGWGNEGQKLLLVLSATLPGGRPFETDITLPLDEEL